MTERNERAMGFSSGVVPASGLSSTSKNRILLGLLGRFGANQWASAKWAWLIQEKTYTQFKACTSAAPFINHLFI